MNYTELCRMISEDIVDRFLLILGYDDFQVWFDNVTNKYYYLEGGINDASECYEAKIIAQLKYDVKHDLQIDHVTAGQLLLMSTLFKPKILYSVIVNILAAAVTQEQFVQ